MATQKYIGMLNGVILCVDSVGVGRFDCTFYHKFSRIGVRVSSEEQLLFQLEDLFDELRFPFSGTNPRLFTQQFHTPVKEERKQVMSDQELLEKHGELGTFIIRVQHRQNSSWQGRITWVDEDKTMNFRSAWEMMKLIDSAMEQYKEDKDKTTDWQ